VAAVDAEANPRALLPVAAPGGQTVAWGFYSPDSLLAVRVLSWGESEPAPGWLADRIRTACQMRARLGLDSDAARLVNAEGDFLPGLIADKYGDTVVVSPHIAAMEAVIGDVTRTLRELFPGTRVFLKRDEHHARTERLALESGYVEGTGDGTCIATEAGVRFAVDAARGQKTGFYLDQRANRGLAASLARGCSMLNLFSYTGAFALRAAAAGAVSVVSVESSAKAVEWSRGNAAANPGLGQGVLQWVQGDAVAFLRDAGRYDVIVADPPPFARRRVEVEGAVRGYTGLFHQVLRSLAPGGFALLFSCSGAVDRLLFRRIVTEAAHRSGRSVQLLQELQADADHPVASAHAEGEYLKGWLVHAQ
jgi:23S rRNA (cytosine1962-C5)-methyltransferase